MAIAPQTSTVTVTVHPGQLLGLTLCQVSNSVKDIAPGLIHELNQRCPGTIEVGDRVMKVAGLSGRRLTRSKLLAKRPHSGGHWPGKKLNNVGEDLRKTSYL